MNFSRLSISPWAVCLGCIWLALDPMGLFGAVLVSATCHEAGHWAVLRLSHIPVRQLEITPLGCIMRTAPLPYRTEAVCALAGPAVNLLFSALTLSRRADFALVNLTLAGFNLLPLWPLDGGRFIRAVLHCRLEPETARRTEHAIAAVAVCLLWLGAVFLTCQLHMGLAPAALAAALTIRTGQEKLVAKKHG